MYVVIGFYQRIVGSFRIMHQFTPSPIMHVAIGGLLGALLITNLFDTLAPSNPIGYLLVLVGLPIGGFV